VVICLKQGASDLHMVQLMPLPVCHPITACNMSARSDLKIIGVDFWATVCKTVRPYAIGPLYVPSVLSVCLSVCDIGVLWSNGWMGQDETWHAGRPRPRPHCVRWGPSSPHGKGHCSPPPAFRPMSIVAKRSPILATAELLLQDGCHFCDH